MGKLFKSMFIWLVVVAVPAQGMAAVTMLHCGPSQHVAQAVQRQVQALPDVAQAAPGEQAAHGYASHHAPDTSTASETGRNVISADASGVAQPGEVTDPVKIAKSTQQKCSACASCCAGVALPSKAIMPPTLDPAREVTVSSPYWASSVVIDGPERPPRILRA